MVTHLPKEDCRFVVRKLPFTRYLAGCLGSAMVLGKLLVPGRPINLDYSRSRATVLAVGAVGGCVDIVFSRLLFLSSFSLSLGDDSI